jgi:Zn-dependent hydrolases, including glyoxylases
MLHIIKETYNPFQENTYILYNEEKQAIIIDPGMYFPEEHTHFFDIIASQSLHPILLLNTHTHLDHLFGNAAVLSKYAIPFAFHQADKPVFDAATSAGVLYGMTFAKSPEPTYYLEENTQLTLGEDSLKILLTPGHSPGSVCFYHEEQHFVIGGDVLFQMSIGRTDLPGGNHNDLIKSIQQQLFSLPDNTVVYSGHGPETTIGFEKMNNPFLVN